jgi:oligoendopeptidase F
MTRKTIPARDNLSDQDKWNLAALFENDKDWEKLIVEVENELETYNKFSGRLKESVSVFKDVLEFHSGVTRRIERLYTYSHLKSDEDKSNQFYLGRHQRAVRLRIRASETASFMIPEIQSVPDEIMNTYLKNDALVEFRFFLEKIMRYKPG